MSGKVHNYIEDLSSDEIPFEITTYYPNGNKCETRICRDDKSYYSDSKPAIQEWYRDGTVKMILYNDNYKSDDKNVTLYTYYSPHGKINEELNRINISEAPVEIQNHFRLEENILQKDFDNYQAYKCTVYSYISGIIECDLWFTKDRKMIYKATYRGGKLYRQVFYNKQGKLHNRINPAVTYYYPCGEKIKHQIYITNGDYHDSNDNYINFDESGIKTSETLKGEVPVAPFILYDGGTIHDKFFMFSPYTILNTPDS